MKSFLFNKKKCLRTILEKSYAQNYVFEIYIRLPWSMLWLSKIFADLSTMNRAKSKYDFDFEMF